MVTRFFGVPIFFAPSWLLIAGLLTITYGDVIQRDIDAVSASTAYATAFGFAVAFALCVLAHELGHTAVSLSLGHPVRRVVIFLLGGVSEIERDPERARDEFLVAAAGPLVSGILAGIAMLGLHLTTAGSLTHEFVALLVWGNVWVLVFNLLPGLPLDGGRMLRAGVWGLSGSRLAATRVGAVLGRVLAIGMAVVGLLLSSRPGGQATVPISLLLALYLWMGATQALRAAWVLDRVPHVTLPGLLRPGLLVPSDISVAEALRRVWAGSARGLVIVDAQDRPAAIVTEAQIGEIPADRQAWTPLSTVARQLEPGLVLPIDLSGDALIDAVRATPASEYLVVHPDGSPAGILALSDLALTLKGSA